MVWILIAVALGTWIVTAAAIYAYATITVKSKSVLGVGRATKTRSMKMKIEPCHKEQWRGKRELAICMAIMGGLTPRPMKQPLLFDKGPRKKPRVHAHVIDAGPWEGDIIEGRHAVRFGCAKCGWESEEWVPIKSVTEGKRGIPCPQCE